MIEPYNIITPTGEVDTRIQFQRKERNDADYYKNSNCQYNILTVFDEIEVIYIKDGS
ncbi:hypothetical protein SDC9_111213 [bioreactor metagenome]|uniref:Uncharacterized protein n=1 Tax=bioreactor metagenome TaxID=1076179 RepID=A0A645BG60_9ZZZZ